MFQDESKRTRKYVITSGLQLQASFFQCPLRRHLCSTFQANTSSLSFHLVENMLQRCNTDATSKSAVECCECSTCSGFGLKWAAGQPTQKHRQSELICLKNTTQTERTRVNSEFKAFLRNKIYTLIHRSTSSHANL